MCSIVPCMDRDGVSTFKDLERRLWEARIDPIKTAGWTAYNSFCVDRLIVPVVVPSQEVSFLVMGSKQ